MPKCMVQQSHTHSKHTQNIPKPNLGCSAHSAHCADSALPTSSCLDSWFCSWSNLSWSDSTGEPQTHLLLIWFSSDSLLTWIWQVNDLNYATNGVWMSTGSHHSTIASRFPVESLLVSWFPAACPHSLPSPATQQPLGYLKSLQSAIGVGSQIMCEKPDLTRWSY